MADTEARGRARALPTCPTPTPTWAQRTEALTHILTHPSHSPSLHSQLFLASRVPCPPRGSSYPPFLCPGASLLRWALTSVFLPRASRLGLPPSSWRSRCPFQLPPPLVPSAAIEQAPERWGEAEIKAYAQRRRARRGPHEHAAPGVRGGCGADDRAQRRDHRGDHARALLGTAWPPLNYRGMDALYIPTL
uniref:Uncharacterized protein n=1 Tax=Avena sativa TaxID=4498 RepID=A0ACD5V7N6_AVESA